MEGTVLKLPPRKSRYKGVDVGESDSRTVRLAFSAMAKTSWRYKPGQYATLQVSDPSGISTEPLMRSFTISQAAAARGASGHLEIGSFVCDVKAVGVVTDWLYNLPADPENQVLGGESGAGETIRLARVLYHTNKSNTFMYICRMSEY